ncbi:CLUMA_CG016811, isoform A [Clunio marinus]|uniref:CLUMA_CG016811, isoform A n=1 Tax=Clunio marinus TaxID=568069 RepID=A0A1J1IYL8_9DIPT|nr:CLUMA_CG016811, isoform A [Clunio marinus]
MKKHSIVKHNFDFHSDKRTQDPLNISHILLFKTFCLVPKSRLTRSHCFRFNMKVYQLSRLSFTIDERRRLLKAHDDELRSKSIWFYTLIGFIFPPLIHTLEKPQSCLFL